MSARGRRSTLDGDGSDSDEELIAGFMDESLGGPIPKSRNINSPSSSPHRAASPARPSSGSPSKSRASSARQRRHDGGSEGDSARATPRSGSARESTHRSQHAAANPTLSQSRAVANPFVDEEAPSYIERAVFPVLLPAIEQVLQSVKKGEEVTDPIGIIAYLLAKHNPNPYATTPGQRSKYLESVVQRMDDKIQRKTSTPTTRSNSSRQRFSQSNVTGSRSRVVSQMTSNSSSTTSISMSLGSSAQP